MKRLGRRWNWGLAWLVLRGQVVSIRAEVNYVGMFTHTIVELTDEQARRWGR